MKLLHTKADVQSWTKKIQTQGSTICLVPTMGFFHAGHLALMKKAGTIADTVLVTLFVNPSQFAPGEDLSSYPRDFAADCKKAESVGIDALFCPDVEEMYPQECQTSIGVAILSHQLCGLSRPTHFNGVATVVTKLFNICRPDSAIFGEKDFQQLAVIRQMVADLNIPVKVYSLPIVREGDGLAMSSRNSYLSTGERKQALCLSQSLRLGRELVASGVVDSRIVIERVSALCHDPAVT
ncbi:MAG: pantoate--beta-alanine ligase, partial [Spirochaetales bacterium]|nr:pantoate--beta-alanine ligase [Spirochaetales bacterium]